jgi:hypothetical protein
MAVMPGNPRQGLDGDKAALEEALKILARPQAYALMTTPVEEFGFA